METVRDPVDTDVRQDNGPFLHLYEGPDPAPGEKAICGYARRLEDRQNGATEKCPACLTLDALQ